MGQIVVPGAPPSIILSAVDRLVATNADGGVSPAASHIILFGQNAGANLGALTNIIAMGFSTLAGGLADVNNSGMTVIGGLSLAALINATPSPTEDGPSTAIGVNNFPALANRFGSNTVLGEGIGASYSAAGAEISRAVLIGTDVLGLQRTLAANGVGVINAVIMGHGAARGGGPFANDGAGSHIQSSVIIGRNAAGNTGFDAAVPGCNIGTSVVIGMNAGADWGGIAANRSVNNSIAIGFNCAATQQAGSENVFIGDNITVTNIGVTDSVIIGSTIAANFPAPGRNTVIGSSAQIGVGIGQCNVIMGFRAGSGLPGASDFRLLFETNDGVSTRTWLYGLAAINGSASGGLVVGQSVAASRDLPGFNILKIMNGTRTGVAPVGGGFLYGDAVGDLHWVTPANNDYALTPSNMGIFAVAALPAAPPAGSTAFANNALAPAFGAAVAGGGAVFVPVYFNGAAWIVG